MRTHTPRCTPDFLTLLFGEATSALSSTALAICFPIIAVTLLNANALEAAAMAASAQAAPLLFGLSAGAIADRADRRRLLVACNAAKAVILIVLCGAASLALLTLPILGVAGLLLSCTQLLSDATLASAIPSLIERRDLTWANSWFQGIASAAQSIGPTTAGLFIQWGAIAPLFAATAVAHAASAVLLANLDLKRRASAEVEEPMSHLAQIVQGVAYIWRDRVQRAIAISTAVFNFFHAAFFAVFPVYALVTLEFSPVALGTLISLAGIAGLAAAACAERMINRWSIPTTLIGSLLVVLPFSVLVTASTEFAYPVNALMLVLAFAGWDFAVVLNIVIEQTIRQATIPQALISRASSTQRFISWGVDPLGALAGGLLAVSSLGLTGALHVSMWGMGAAGLILLLSREVRALPRTFDDAAPSG